MSTRELLIKRYCDELPGLDGHLKDPWLLDQCDVLARYVLLLSNFREEVHASLKELALDRDIHERLEMGFNACLEIGAAIGTLRSIAVAGDWALAGEKANMNLKRERDKLSTERHVFWGPWQQEFRAVLADDPKERKGRARGIIGDRMTRQGFFELLTGEPYTMTTLKKWLK